VRRSAIIVCGIVYIAVGLFSSAYSAKWAADTVGTLDSEDGLTRAQFPFSIGLLLLSIGLVVLMAASVRSTFVGSPAAAGLWLTGCLACALPLSLVVGLWVDSTELSDAWAWSAPALALASAVVGYRALRYGRIHGRGSGATTA
jgi:hypothetical protein